MSGSGRRAMFALYSPSYHGSLEASATGLGVGVNGFAERILV